MGTAAFFSLRGIRPQDFVNFPLSEKILMYEAMSMNHKIEIEKLKILANCKV